MIQIWTAFVTIIFVMPTVRPTTAENMNYAIAFLGAILAFSLLYWFISGRKFYTGPLIEADVNEESSQTRSSEEDVVDKRTAEKGDIIG